MSRIVRKFIAVMLVIWLPLFSGGAMAASISMLHGSCHEVGMEAMQDMDEHQHDQSPAHDQSSCSALCHLACGGYLGVQAIKELDILQAAALITPYLFSFNSITSIPLLPPPHPLA